MNTEISDYINVREKLEKLGCNQPESLSVLPNNFEKSDSIEDFRQTPESGTVKTLLRNNSLPYSDIVGPEQRIPSIHNNSIEWIAPTIFVSCSLLSQNPASVTIALSVLANYITDYFRGDADNNDPQVKLDVIVEKTDQRTYNRISYSGPVDGLKELSELVVKCND